MTYSQFLSTKAVSAKPCGLSDLPELHPVLFPFQADVVNFALKLGRAALFLDTGLGKTLCQLEWARHVPGPVIIAAPLAVAQQTAREAKDKLGMEIFHSRDGSVRKKRHWRETMTEEEKERRRRKARASMRRLRARRKKEAK